MKRFLIILATLLITVPGFADEKQNADSANLLIGAWEGRLEIHFDDIADESSPGRGYLDMGIKIYADSLTLTFQKWVRVGILKSKTDPIISFSADIFGFKANFIGVRDNQKIKGLFRIPDLLATGFWEVKKP